MNGVSKFMRAAEKATESNPKIPGKRIIGELVAANVALTPMAQDLHGKWGPMMDHILFETEARQDLDIPSTHPNTVTMFRRARAPEYPMSILTMATMNWKRNRTRWFYGHTHTSPSPRE